MGKPDRVELTVALSVLCGLTTGANATFADYEALGLDGLRMPDDEDDEIIRAKAVRIVRDAILGAYDEEDDGK